MAFGDDDGRDAAVVDHGGVASRAEVFFHARTGRAGPGPFKNGRTDAKPHVSQGGQVDTGHDDVSPQKFRNDFLATYQTGDDWQMLGLNQSDLSLRWSSRSTVMIASNAAVDDLNHLRRRYRRSTGG